MAHELRKQAQEMRRKGMSIKEISGLLNVAKSSVSIWVREISLTDEQITLLHTRRRKFGNRNKGAEANRERNRTIRLAYQESGRARARELRPLHLAGCMLYWAEGAKQRNGVYFVNSDLNMVLLFMRFLREELDVSDSEIALRIHCHSRDSEEIARIENHWATQLKLPRSSIKKTYVKEGINSRHNRLENGVCDIRVHKTELVQHIFGAIQEYGGFDNPDWLF